jgi:hypothetical protein
VPPKQKQRQNKSPTHGVFTRPGLASLITQHGPSWGLSPTLTAKQALTELLSRRLIEERELRPEDPKYKLFRRYVLKGTSALEVALSLRPRSYLTHATAVFLHGLSDQVPGVIYANQEQTPKPGGGALTQAGIDRAFSGRQRLSAYSYWYDDQRIVLLSGKSTGDLGVETRQGANGEELRVTGLERTLIDIAVRPIYAGGIYQVLEAYRGARGRVDVQRLLQVLEGVGHLYPYQQSIGFLMERAGFGQAELTPLRNLVTTFDFYLAHGLKERDYDPTWRIYFPREF